MFNCRVVEDMLQEYIDHLPLGLRLHRRAGAGGYSSPRQLEPGFLGKVYITTFLVTKETDADGIMGINGHPARVRFNASFDRF